MEPAAAIAPYLQFSGRELDDLVADFERYLALLSKWQRVQNLVSRETLPDFWKRHVADSLQVLRSIEPKADHLILDLGSGAGLPIVPLAIALRDRPATRLIAVEPNQRKASFLRAVARELGLKLDVLAVRAEEIDSRETIRPTVVTSRALAPLVALCGFAAPFFGPETRAIFHKGREYVDELTETRAFWSFDVIIVRSDTGSDSALLDIRNLKAKAAA